MRLGTGNSELNPVYFGDYLSDVAKEVDALRVMTSVRAGILRGRTMRATRWRRRFCIEGERLRKVKKIDET
jgi:hypothetical protein